MGWLITLGILVLLAILPLGVLIWYNEDGLQVKVVVGPVRCQVVPAKKAKEQKNRKEKTQKKTNKTTKSGDTRSSAGKKGGSLSNLMPFVKLALEFLGAFTQKLRINRLDLNVVLAGNDPCDLAINYGKAWTALGNLWPRLEEVFVIRKRDVQVQCDFESTMTHVTVFLNASITLGRLLYLIVCYGIRALVQYIKITNKGKGGAAV